MKAVQIDNYGGAHRLRDTGLLESAVFRPQIGYYNTVAEQAAAPMESLDRASPKANGTSFERCQILEPSDPR